MIEKAGDECHGDVADDVSACDAEGDADAACPACEDRNANSSTAKVASEIGTSPASGTEMGAKTQVTAAQSAQRTSSYVVNFMCV